MEITIGKKDLIQKLEGNHTVHVAEHALMMNAYFKKVFEEATEIAKQALVENPNIKPRISANKPISYADEYINMIEMLKASTSIEFVLSEKDYKKYVKNEWEWSGQLAMMKTSYGIPN